MPEVNDTKLPLVKLVRYATGNVTGAVVKEANLKIIDAASALLLIRDATTDLNMARSVLSQHLKLGLLPALAKVVIREIDFDLVDTKAPANQSSLMFSFRHAGQGTRLTLGAHFFAAENKGIKETAPWNFEANVFAHISPVRSLVYEPGKLSEAYIEAPDRTVAYGVAFNADHIQAIADANRVTNGLVKSHDQKRRRRDLSTHDWNNLLVDLQKLASTGTLHLRFGAYDDRGSQAKLERAIAELFSERGKDEPSKSTLARKAKGLFLLNIEKGGK